MPILVASSTLAHGVERRVVGIRRALVGLLFTFVVRVVVLVTARPAIAMVLLRHYGLVGVVCCGTNTIGRWNFATHVCISVVMVETVVGIQQCMVLRAKK